MWDWGTYFLFVFVVTISIPFLRLYDSSKKTKSFWLFMGLLPTYLVLVLRGKTVGIDLEAYNEHILDVPDISYSDLPFLFSEPISEMIYWLSYKLGGLRAFILLTSTIEYIFVFLSLKELNKKGIDVCFFFILFYSYVITRSFNIVLNCLAISCSLCAYVYLMNVDNRSRYKYWLYAILAIGIHNTAVINIPIYFLCKPIKNKFKTTFLYRITLMLVVSFLSFLILTKYVDVFFELSNGQYNKYESLGKAGFGILLSALPFVLLLFIYRKQMKLNSKSLYMPYLLLLLFDLIFAQLRYVYPGLERITMYTNMGSYFLLNLLYISLFKRIGFPAFLFFVLWGLATLTYWLYIYNVTGGDGQGVGLMPYHLWE